MRERFLIWRPWFLVYALLIAVAVRPAETQTNPLKTNVTQVKGTALDVNSGNKGNGTLRVAIATDQVQLTNALKVDGSGVTQPVSGTFWQATQPVSGTFWQATQPVSGTFFQATQPVSGTVTATQGTAANLKVDASGAVVPASQSGTWTVQPGNTANTTAWKVDGSAVTQPVSGTVTANAGTGTLNVAPQAAASGGATPYFYPSSGAANQDATVLKGSAGQLYAFAAFNTTTSQRYVWLYNLASGATSASTVVYCLALPANATGSGAAVNIPVGMYFSTGISFRITTGAPGSNTGAASTNDVIISAASF